MARANKFDKLAAALKGEAVEETLKPISIETVPTEPPKKGRAKGKRSNPNYTQVGAYIPKQLDRDVKRLLIDEEIDFSDLVADLLAKWLSSKSTK